MTTGVKVMLSDFLRPTNIDNIRTAVLLIPPQLKKAAVIIGPAVTLCWIFFYEADKMSVMFGIIFGIISVIAAVYSLHVNDRFELAGRSCLRRQQHKRRVCRTLGRHAHLLGAEGRLFMADRNGVQD